ncbi:MAG: prolyl oligopeptidase family serine peptidase [Bacteroidia bacterium]|nr:prolyl oligopeptidase family serine peptidase [Bacteroidia bacterium]
MNTFKEEIQLPGANDLVISLDVTFNPNARKAPIAVFCHGFKGFKDWGAWNLVAESMAQSGIFFVKLNFSHNGVLSTDLSDIKDAQCFGQNTISKELDDLGKVIDWLVDDNEEYRHYFDAENITLIGHSRGAATTVLQTIEDDRIQRVITWAGAFNLSKYASLEDDKVWQERGYTEVKNGRTGDIYPIDYGFKRDLDQNAERFDLQKNIAMLDQPFLLIHGQDDEVAPLSNSKKINQVVKHSLFLEVEGNHTFGASHPWTDEFLPEDLEDVVNESIEYILM